MCRQGACSASKAGAGGDDSSSKVTRRAYDFNATARPEVIDNDQVLLPHLNGKTAECTFALRPPSRTITKTDRRRPSKRRK